MSTYGATTPPDSGDAWVSYPKKATCSPATSPATWATHDPAPLLLDEATAALEPATEAAVPKASTRVATARTTFVVAHRLATAARAGRILVLDGGRVVEQGSHTELLALGGHYARLWSAGEPTAPGRR